ncbi:MAG: hypothetical protein HRU17_23150 [Polyangiaceae bacterium]|nr:hypothetical protein [Polyangiaceae bacterium]
MTPPRTAPSHGPLFVARWDLDKTYLRTEFDTVRDLIRTALESPEEKVAVPGAGPLLQALGESGAHIHILSGSPRQLRNSVEAKLRLDKVRFDELSLKPNLSNIFRFRFRGLRDQLGYKLPELLEGRVRIQNASTLDPMEVLVGDDAEADAFVYCLYADICSERVSDRELRKILSAGQVYRDLKLRTLSAAASVRKSDCVERILIHLDRQTPPSTFQAFGSRVVPFFNYFQAACVLAEDGRLSCPALFDVATVFLVRHGFDHNSLASSYLDLQRRGHTSGQLPEQLNNASTALDQARDPTAADELRQMVALMRESPSAASSRLTTPAMDYRALARRHRGGRNRSSAAS